MLPAGNEDLVILLNELICTHIFEIYTIYIYLNTFFLKSNRPCSFCVIFITNCPYSEKSPESCLICSIQQLVASYKS